MKDTQPGCSVLLTCGCGVDWGLTCKAPDASMSPAVPSPAHECHSGHSGSAGPGSLSTSCVKVTQTAGRQLRPSLGSDQLR